MFIEVFTTTDKREDAEKIAKILLEKRLSACVQISEINSYYWWKGKIENSKEFLCIIKTKKELYEEVEKEIKNIHPYEIPEIISIEIFKGNENYFKWMEKEIKK
ncbi:MAG: divalent-cation tolerance protein CutA [Candidatus Altarchaeaceae archaeon]